MAKCIRCGKSTIVRGHVKLSDSEICTPCFKSLGFKLNEAVGASIYKYEDIQNGRESYYAKKRSELAAKVSEEHRPVRVAHYGEQRGLNPTGEELEMYEIVCEILENNGVDTKKIKLVRKSDSYLTIRLGPTDVARIKYTDRAKWILFPYGSNERIRINDVGELNSYSAELVEAYQTAKSINSKV